jgi:RHS repeat-associated protein
MLGTTVGSKSNGKYSAAALTAFGERLDNVDGTSLAIRSLGEGWFTGKPYIEGLGHAFLFRNYRANLGKWQTADPMGYPDGWNQLAYCNNLTIGSVDFAGALVTAVYSITRKEFTVTDNQTGRSVTIQNSISGDNVVGHQWVPDVGPIPIGSYTILDHWENHLGWFELWRDDAWFDDFTTGPDGVERGNFRLHPGTFSAGCITLPKDSDETRTALNLIGGTATEIIYPLSIKFEEKIKFGTLTVIE